MDTIQTAVLIQSRPNLICTLWIMRGGTLLISCRGVKGQGYRLHSDTIIRCIHINNQIKFKHESALYAHAHTGKKSHGNPVMPPSEPIPNPPLFYPLAIALEWI